MGLILVSGTDLRVSCILAKTYTTELHPTAVDSFFIPHLVPTVRKKEVFSSQQPLERRVPTILSSLDPVQLRPSSEFLVGALFLTVVDRIGILP